jgi:hypothetical protein
MRAILDSLVSKPTEGRTMDHQTLKTEPAKLGAAKASLNAFLTGHKPLTGLDLYYQLEAATPLSEFHLILRPGPRNRWRSGLQQSYGDHNRLLMHGLDRMVAADLIWFRSRVVEGSPVTDEQLLVCFAAVRRLNLDATALAALWVGGALHDCGMLTGRTSDVDVEDGVVLGAELVNQLCPAATAPLALFAIRNHDYIKQVCTGEVPGTFIAAQIATLPKHLQPAALTVLGMLQVAGAASLGEGRLTPFRINLFQRCAVGDLLSSMTPLARLAELLGAGEDRVDPAPTADARKFLDGLSSPERHRFDQFLGSARIHRWHKAFSALPDASPALRWGVLHDVERIWALLDGAFVLVLA